MHKHPRLAAPFGLLGLSVALVAVLWRREQPAPGVRLDQAVSRCDVPVGWAGHGLLCLSAQDAARMGLGAGPRRHAKGGSLEAGAEAPLTGLRRLLAGIPIDLQTADETDLQALPEVGEALARSLIAARRAGRLRCQAELAAVPGLGRQRRLRLLRYVAPLPQDCPLAHPTK